MFSTGSGMGKGSGGTRFGSDTRSPPCLKLPSVEAKKQVLNRKKCYIYHFFRALWLFLVLT